MARTEPVPSDDDPARESGSAAATSWSGEDRAVARKGVAVGLSAAAYGISYGALAVAAGLDVWQTCVMSLLMFTGGSQFALVGVIATGGVAAGPAAIASAAILGIRNGIYGIRVAPIVGSGRWRRLAAAWVTIDESTAVATTQSTLRTQRIGFWVTAVSVFVGWNLTSLIGALIGNALGDVRMYGLDAAAAAAFLGLLWPRLRQLQTVAVATAAAVIATVTTPVLIPGLPVLVAGIVAVIVGGLNWFGSRNPQPEPPGIPT
ncbi:AzlC family ABC transporter permease [Lacisediminihabitans sp. H27-G8]|uniref:AzlC family ABC transporter permease n=1 Tax=Lacisediminihabitans sp. H27-G8 TaxID=3111909 RepID=UPI0038FBE493